MPKIVEQSLPGRTSTQTRGSDAAKQLLRRAIPVCDACSGSLDGHSYRFYACHPAPSTGALDHGASAFLQAILAEDWSTVQATQMPAVNQPLYVLYAIACPHPPEGSGMVALLRTQPDQQPPDTVIRHLALAPQSMAVLRAQCPTCQWISFASPLQFQQDLV